MSKYTKQEVIEGRKCGLKYFDKAVGIIGRQQLIDNGIENNKEYPGIWKGGWNNFNWAIGNAVIDIINAKGDISQTWNLDEALNDDEIKYIAKTCNFNLPFTPSWPRKTTTNKSNGKISTDQVKELISSWLKDNNEFKQYFTNFFGRVGLNKEETEERCKKFKCEPNEAAIINATIEFVSSGKNWKRYEKGKFSLDEYNEEDNGQERIVGWNSVIFIPNYDKYTVRRFESKCYDFEEKTLRVLSDEDDTEIVSWAIFDS